MYKKGEYQQAIDKMVGVMNADPKYHLQGLPKLAQVLELSGDAPEAIKAELEEDARRTKQNSSQDIGIALSGQNLRPHDRRTNRRDQESANWPNKRMRCGIAPALAKRSTFTRAAKP